MTWQLWANFLGGNVSAVNGQLLYTLNAAYASPSYPDAVVGAVYSDYIGMAQEGGCPTCSNPSTLDQNYLSSHYIGPYNPKTYAGEWDYSTPPKTLAGANAMIHDKAYDKLLITGASGLILDTRAINADWYFVTS